MIIKQIYTSCLSEASYIISSENDAVIIDPLREPFKYIDYAKKNNLKIKYILETHFHADFVSGHLELSKLTKSKIIFGPNAKTNFEFIKLNDNDEIKFGGVKIKLLHTPGHTMESSCYLLFDKNNKQHSIFTGDTLFINSVGRPDLAVSSNVSLKQLASMLYESIKNKILPLNDDITIYPAHGAGSTCGKNISNKTFDTLKNQKIKNFALNSSVSKDEFIKIVTKDISKQPKYFIKNVKLNKSNNISKVSEITKKQFNLSVENFKKEQKKGALVLDVRHQKTFIKGHIVGSIFIGLNGKFAPWVGQILKNPKTKILLICDNQNKKEAVIRLSRVGFDNVVGFLDGGLEEWQKCGEEISSINQISAIELFNKKNNNLNNIIDVREKDEYNFSKIYDAKNLPLSCIYDNHRMLDKKTHYIIHCQAGYRSVIAISILKKLGYKKLTDLDQGYLGFNKINLMSL